MIEVSICLLIYLVNEETINAKIAKQVSVSDLRKRVREEWEKRKRWRIENL